MQLTVPRSISRALVVVGVLGAVAGSASAASAASTPTAAAPKIESAKLVKQTKGATKKLSPKQMRALKRQATKHVKSARSLSGSNCVAYGLYFEYCFYSDGYGLSQVDERYFGVWTGWTWFRGYGWRYYS